MLWPTIDPALSRDSALQAWISPSVSSGSVKERQLSRRKNDINLPVLLRSINPWAPLAQCWANVAVFLCGPRMRQLRGQCEKIAGSSPGQIGSYWGRKLLPVVRVPGLTIQANGPHGGQGNHPTNHTALPGIHPAIKIPEAGAFHRTDSIPTDGIQVLLGLDILNNSGFRPPLCTYRLNWARRTSWEWWNDSDDTVLQTQDSKFEPWRSEAAHATSRSRRLPTILTFTRGWGINIFVSFKPPRPGTEPRALAWKAAMLTTTLGPPPWGWIKFVYTEPVWSLHGFLLTEISPHFILQLLVVILNQAWGAEILPYKPWRPKGFFNLKSS